MGRVFDVFPFFQELDIAEIRLNEMAPLVDRFIISEAGETYGGDAKPYIFGQNFARFAKFSAKIIYQQIPKLEPECTDRVSGRKRERFQRDQIISALRLVKPHIDDVIIFSDADEIPRRSAIEKVIASGALVELGIHRLKQRSYYYNVQTMVDYGHDFASRARVGLYQHLLECNSLYEFRMYRKGDFMLPVIEEGGWHFSYFGGVGKIKTKVAALAPFLNEYKLFGDEQLAKDIAARRDLHHRRTEMPEVFEEQSASDSLLPQYFLENRDKFAHFVRS